VLWALDSWLRAAEAQFFIFASARGDAASFTVKAKAVTTAIHSAPSRDSSAYIPLLNAFLP
jgi:hypothetical protein